MLTIFQDPVTRETSQEVKLKCILYTIIETYKKKALQLFTTIIIKKTFEINFKK